ncbi:hypothetical protein HK102_000828 [Quaeritorhiza haematococci]|nr:hypothetical protein HK102_000828 [Quaeritorhiza haematococci]
MAPEVITSEQQGTAYDFKADIWSLGITAIEMAECCPPMFDMHPMRVLFMIPKLDPPVLKDKQWSNTFRDFLKMCLEKDPDKRPSADQLLQHEFVKPSPQSSVVVMDLIERAREAKRLRLATDGKGADGEEIDDEEDGEGDRSALGPDQLATVVKTPTAPTVAISSPSVVVPQPQGNDGAEDYHHMNASHPNLINQEPAKPSTPATDSNPNLAAARKPTFKAMRICRLTIKVNCAEFMGDTLLLGTDDGLFAFEINATDAKMVPLSNRRYLQLDYLEDLGIIVSRSGKYDVVATHDVSSLTKFRKRQKFETETKLRKMKETKGCDFYSVARQHTSVYLCVAMPKSILISKWAPHPFNRFMKVKEVSIDTRISSMDLIEYNQTDLRLYVGTPLRFKVLDIQTATSEDIFIPGVPEDKLGRPIRGMVFNDSFIICYQHMGIITYIEASSKDSKTLTWRNPLTFASKIGQEFLVAGSSSVVDVINSETGKIVHVFETKKDKIRSLELLVCKGHKLFLLAEEEKDGQKSASIIHILLEPST